MSKFAVYKSTPDSLDGDLIRKVSMLIFGIAGAVPSAVARFLYPGANVAAVMEVQVELREARTFNRISVKATGAPGGALVDTYTVRKNGVDTALVTSLTGAATENHDDSQSVPFAAGDLLSVRVDTALLSASTDPMRFPSRCMISIVSVMKISFLRMSGFTSPSALNRASAL